MGLDHRIIRFICVCLQSLGQSGPLVHKVLRFLNSQSGNFKLIWIAGLLYVVYLSKLEVFWAQLLQKTGLSLRCSGLKVWLEQTVCFQWRRNEKTLEYSPSLARM